MQYLLYQISSLKNDKTNQIKLNHRRENWQLVPDFGYHQYFFHKKLAHIT